MGRPPLNREITHQLMVSLIEAVKAIMSESGIESVTLRKTAQRAGINSAIVYKYFTDLDELILFASIDVLKDYTNTLINNISSDLDAREAYLLIWKNFCEMSFKDPEIVSKLFFSKHRRNLESVIRRYYEMFPEQLHNAPEFINTMLINSDLYQRNLGILQPVLENSASAETVAMINDLTVSFFYKLLEQKINEKNASSEMLTDKMLAACIFLLDGLHLKE